MLVLGEDDDEDELREDIMSDLTDLMNSVDKSGKGVCVQASTLGSLEALLEFLRTSKIPVSLCIHRDLLVDRVSDEATFAFIFFF